MFDFGGFIFTVGQAATSRIIGPKVYTASGEPNGQTGDFSDIVAIRGPCRDPPPSPYPLSCSRADIVSCLLAEREMQWQIQKLWKRNFILVSFTDWCV
ncbi:hypothetical protein ElyMa_006509800 [Elysia marginata]|uniref:Uncharacterized protein n=1 Tax=Elysia marginata TaxID=1093978 RepID=A0AAV4I4N8_9GAST|nr:hypothetical protein ElyMa_006509800 [Elysia marginata]